MIGQKIEGDNPRGRNMRSQETFENMFDFISNEGNSY
jgi:hypothetical protein